MHSWKGRLKSGKQGVVQSTHPVPASTQKENDSREDVLENDQNSKLQQQLSATKPTYSSTNSPQPATKKAKVDETLISADASQKMPEFTRLADSTRNKIIQMIYEALMIEDGLNTEHAMNLAEEIELELFNQCGKKVDARYKSSFRSKYLNLKDKSNPELRQSVLYGGVSVKRFVEMTPQVIHWLCLL